MAIAVSSSGRTFRALAAYLALGRSGVAPERVAHRVLDRLGLAEHEAILVAHGDRGHPHVQVLVHRVHPVTGRAWDRWQDQAVIQQVLREEERALGIREVQGRLTDSPGFPRPASPDVVPSDRAPRVASGTRARDRSSAGPAGESSGDVGRSSLYERARAAAPVLRAATSWGELESEIASRGMRLGRAVRDALLDRDGRDASLPVVGRLGGPGMLSA